MLLYYAKNTETFSIFVETINEKAVLLLNQSWQAVYGS